MSTARWKQVRHARTAWLLLGGLAVGTLAGCGGNDLPLVPVSGTVTFDGGPCPAVGNVNFTPIEVAPGLPKRPGSGRFREDGKFVVTSFKEGDGLLPGRYRVAITCFSGLPDRSSPDPFGAVSYVPDDYRPVELVVEEGDDPITVNYDVPPKK